MNITRRILFLTFLVVSSLHLNAQENKYYTELKKFKNESVYKNMFEKRTNFYLNPGLQLIERDINNYKSLNELQRFFKTFILGIDTIVVTSENMPQLYSYIKTICKENEIEVPVVFMPRWKGFFNAFAQKVFMGQGSILIGQDILLDRTDEEIEAVVAHELGHIKYDHVNKTLLTFLATFVSLHFLNKAPASHTPDMKLYRGYFHLFVSSIITRLIIGKKFEREADQFACKVGKAGGIIKFFERIEEIRQEQDKYFDHVSDVLVNNKLELQSPTDYLFLNLRFYLTKFGHKINRAFKLLYEETRLGDHPSAKARIESAKAYLASQ